MARKKAKSIDLLLDFNTFDDDNLNNYELRMMGISVKSNVNKYCEKESNYE